ncbi:ABC transporter ATP-binding protein [Mesoplasma syrphidae]|uniref:ABC transporter ATP-binding protein n=1 Tax=Mesoplasma syrphidae TaxID=225999 RepID=A0A2K9BKF7_9MOLU|nr:ABC transporter ATP-binding protein [Mesoplasma syrphidae]AUF83711.1 ABC transporter ATP-binding protein [Mesoplasma syrphidae]
MSDKTLLLPAEQSSDDIIRFTNYFKKFNYKERIGPLNFGIKKNKVTILIGRSGSGKSVILNSIMGSYARYKGTIDINGYRRKSISGYKINSEIGFYTQMDFITYDIKLITYLNQISKVMGLSKKYAEEQIDKLLELFQLKEHSDKKLKDFSWGMKNRLNLIISLLKDPNLIILDEPGANLDSVWRKKIKEILLEYKNMDKTVLLVVHNIDEVFDMVDDIILIEHGQIIYQSELKNLKLYFRSKLYFKTDIAKHSSYKDFKAHLLSSGLEIFSEDIENNTLEIGVLKQESDKINFLMALIIKYNLFLEEIVNIPMNFESIYNSLVYSEQVKELEFYFKKLTTVSRIKLFSLLAKSGYKLKRKIKNSSSEEYRTEKTALIEENKMLLETMRNKQINTEVTNKIIEILDIFFNRNEILSDIDKKELTNSVKILLKENFLTKYEEGIAKLAVEILLRNVKDETTSKMFAQILKNTNKNGSKITKKRNLKINRINIVLINENSEIAEQKNQLFW